MIADFFFVFSVRHKFGNLVAIINWIIAKKKYTKDVNFHSIPLNVGCGL